MKNSQLTIDHNVKGAEAPGLLMDTCRGRFQTAPSEITGTPDPATAPFAFRRAIIEVNLSGR